MSIEKAKGFAKSEAEKGTDKVMVKALLITNGLVGSEAEAVKVLKEIGLTKSMKRGFNQAYYDYLAEGKKDWSEVEKWLRSNGSENTVRHLSHYKGIFGMANAIWAVK